MKKKKEEKEMSAFTSAFLYVRVRTMARKERMKGDQTKE